MIQRLRQWLADRATVQLQRKVNRLHTENLELKAEVLKSNGGQPIRLTPEESQQFEEL